MKKRKIFILELNETRERGGEV